MDEPEEISEDILDMDDTEDETTSRRGFLTVAAVTGIGVAVTLLHRIISTSGDGNSPQSAGEGNDTIVTGRRDSQSTNGGNVLIVYLTRTRNTETVARLIHDEVGGEIVEVEPAESYPEDYDAIVSQVDRENDVGYTPPLEGNVENIWTYDTVFIGFPTWDMQLPPPIKTFLSEYDLSDKTVVPFNTNGGYGVGSSLQTVWDRCPNAEVRDGFSTRGGLERDGIYLAIEGERKAEVRTKVAEWIENIRV